MKIFVNLITIFRLSFTIILATLKNHLQKSSFISAVIILFLSDCIDGLLARKFKVQTLFGSLLDTIADKILCIVLYIFLIDEKPILIPILICEITIAIINIIAIIMKKKPKSNIIGKIKMWFVGINILTGYLYYFNIVTYTFIFISTALTFIMEIATIISYILNLLKPRSPSEIKLKIKDIKDLNYILFNTEYYLSTF